MSAGMVAMVVALLGSGLTGIVAFIRLVSLDRKTVNRAEIDGLRAENRELRVELDKIRDHVADLYNQITDCERKRFEESVLSHKLAQDVARLKAKVADLEQEHGH